MGLRDRLRRAEKATDERTVLLTCRDNGEKLRVPEDAGLRLIVADWCEGAGQEHHDSLVDWLSPYLERGLLDEQRREWPIGDVGGGCVGLRGRLRRAVRAAEEEMITIPQRDGTAARFPQLAGMEAFTNLFERLGAGEGAPPEHPLIAAARSSSDPRWSGSFYAANTQDGHWTDPVEELSEL